MNSIPIDLIFEIFSRLPAKSIARCPCVSKLWASMLHRPDFTKLFLTRSSARPRLLLAIEQNGVWRFFSLLQPQNPCEKSSSLVVAAEFHTKFPRGDNKWICCSSCRQFSCGYASGLIYFSGMWISKMSEVPVICNPTTGRRYGRLPKLARYRNSYSFLGFDPVDKEYKVLFMAYPYCSEGGDHRILTLGTGKMRWRKIQCSLTHEPLSEGICIDGVLYYLAKAIDETPYEIVCFDVKSEKFTFIRFIVSDDWRARLINYKGKLGVINRKYGNTTDAIELRMSILEDVEKQEWSKYAYTLRDKKLVDHRRVIYVVGVTAMTGEIVFSMRRTSKPFYVFYYNPEKNTLQSVEIQGFGANHETLENRSVYTFIDHVEDLNVNDARKSSIYRFAFLVSSEVAEDLSDSDKEPDIMDLMTPLDNRIY